MGNVASVFVLAGMIVAGILYKRVLGRMDYARIRAYAADGGSEVLDIVWQRFGEGWLGSGGQRIYQVTFRTRDGRILTGTCKTSGLGGVYWTGNAPPAGPVNKEMP